MVLSPIALARRSTRAVAVAFLIQVVMVLRPGYLPNMYVLGLLPFAALIVAGASEHALAKVAGHAVPSARMVGTRGGRRPGASRGVRWSLPLGAARP